MTPEVPAMVGTLGCQAGGAGIPGRVSITVAAEAMRLLGGKLTVGCQAGGAGILENVPAVCAAAPCAPPKRPLPKLEKRLRECAVGEGVARGVL